MQKELFDNPQTSLQSDLLPKDGQAQYLPELFDEGQCIDLFHALKVSLQWQPEQVLMFGQKISTRRKVAWVADDGCSYTYSGIQKIPQSWTPELLFIKRRIEVISEWEFNSCLLNFYHDGEDGMGWHSDNEAELDRKAPIASLSLGGSRKFAFRHKKDKTVASLFLENGSLLIMRPPVQEFWTHSLLKTKTAVSPRINLTFRKIIQHQ